MSARSVHSVAVALCGFVALLMVAAACGPLERDPPEAPPPVNDEPPELPPELTDPAAPPDPHLLLPPLEEYATDDDVETGELEESLAHGEVPYSEVRRRLILDEQGFTTGEVTVVTVEPEADGAERVLDHRYGDAPPTPVEIAGADMTRVEAEPHAALAWTGPTWVVTFERGAEVDDEWLEDLAQASVEAVSERES